MFNIETRMMLLYKIKVAYHYQNTLKQITIHLKVKNKTINIIFRYMNLCIYTIVANDRHLNGHNMFIFSLRYANKINTVLNFYFYYG